MDLKNKISTEISDKKLFLSETAPGLLEKYPIDNYSDEIRRYTERDYYNYTSHHLAAIFKDISEKYGQAVLAAYHKMALAALMSETLKLISVKPFPGDINVLITDWFHRVIDDFSKQPDDFYDHENDLFIKDRGVCSLRIIPAGAQVVTTSYISRGYLINPNPVKTIGNILFTVLKMRGFGPFFEIHTDNRCLEEFNPEGWNRCYARIASLLKENKRIKGMAGGSWFYDPHLEKISPHLSYLRELPVKNRAGIFKIGSSRNSINDALSTSRTRRKLYEQGRYLPVSYLLIWCRNDLIYWADNYGSNRPGE